MLEIHLGAILKYVFFESFYFKSMTFFNGNVVFKINEYVIFTSKTNGSLIRGSCT